MRILVPAHARVVCIDGDAGTSEELIVDPGQRRLTHVVVREHGLADSERLVAVGHVDETTEGAIWLRCTRHELHGMDDFIEAHFVDVAFPPGPEPSYGLAEPPSVVFSERIPKGEIALRRSTVVEADDGPVGHLESVVVEAPDDRITHVLVRTRHFLTRQEVAVPARDVARWFSDRVFLRLSRRDVEGLPHVPLHEAHVLPALGSADRDLVAEGPRQAGVRRSEVDVSHLEGAHVLAEEVRPRLRAQRFTDEQILDWAKAFLASEHSGGDVEFLAWVKRKEQASKSRPRPSEQPDADNGHESILERPGDRS